MRVRFPSLTAPALLVAGVLLVCGCTAAPERKAAPKPPAASPGDLPQRSYPVEGRVVDLLHSEERIARLAEAVRRDIESDLREFEIEDNVTLKRLHGALVSVYLLENRLEEALAAIHTIRRAEDNETRAMTAGLATEALIRAKMEAGPDAARPELRAAFRRILAERIGALPWDEVQNVIEQIKGQTEIISENLLEGVVQAQVEPAVQQSGALAAQRAQTVIDFFVVIRDFLPIKEDMIAVFQQAIDANRSPKSDVWSERAVALDAGKEGAPVLAAVWDTGTDPSLFMGRLFVNPDEEFNGKDDDGNGFADDVHGVAYDIDARPSAGALCPLGDAAPRISRALRHIKGLMDLRASVDSPEAEAFKSHLAGLHPDRMKPFLEDLGLASQYLHGTHVAGILAEGNPWLRLLIARVSYDHRMRPIVRDEAWGERFAGMCRETVAYFANHRVRLAVVAWNESLADVEWSLETNGVGRDATERRAIARRTFERQREGLREALAGAPQILFVACAPAEQEDADAGGLLPSSIELPNLLVVGGLDEAGDPAAFTTFGSEIRVFANGLEVESVIPGGMRLKMSGPGVAAPAAANLAAKLLALAPELSPLEVIGLIEEGAEERVLSGRSCLLIDPRRSVEILRERAASRDASAVGVGAHE